MPLIKNTERTRLISEIAGSRNEYAVKNVMALIEILILETREENDRSGVRGVFRNQGKIEMLKQLRDYIEGKSLPTINKLLDRLPE